MLYDAFSEAGPFDRFWDLRREFDRLFDEALPSTGRATRSFTPTFDVDEAEDGLTLRMDVPGVSPDELKVSIDGRIVTVEGERSAERDDASRLHRNERVFGKFSRSVHLPDNYDIDAVEAQHQNGILTLHVPKAAAAKPRNVKIEAH